MDNVTNQITKDEMILQELERMIKSNHFSSKEQLNQYMINLRNGQISNAVLTNEKMKELLDLFDNLNRKQEMPLDTQKYGSISIENQDLIVAKETDQVLKTLEGASAFVDDFKKTQNKITTDKEDGLANADTVFQYMANHQKEEVTLVSLNEAFNRNDIDIEMLNKIKFFITNPYINPYIFKINIENGLFYNIETNEAYEVRKNTDTNKYEIYKSGEKIYTEEETLENEPEAKEKEHGEPQKSDDKVRKLVPSWQQNNNRAAFTKIGLLIINIITFALMITTIILLKK